MILNDTVRLAELVSPAELQAALLDGLVRMRTHPDDPALQIWNYTEKAQYTNTWTNVTRTCRGLIVRDGIVVARPWAKFFNYGQHPEGSLDLDAMAIAMNKEDGSLGIAYEGIDGRLGIATRGSFTSDQAIHATELLRTRYPEWRPKTGWTFLFEIVYPENRIVLDYGKTDDLILLGAVRVRGGHPVAADVAAHIGDDAESLWTGPVTEILPAYSLREALAIPPRPNAEGLVVMLAPFGEPRMLVKIKQEDYVQLHRLITGLSERSIWEHLVEHAGDYDALLAAVPDEFHGWVRGHADQLIAKHDAIVAHAHATYDEILTGLGGVVDDRADFAHAAKQRTTPGLLFQLLDGRDISPAVWKSLRPVGAKPMVHTSEDVA